MLDVSWEKVEKESITEKVVAALRKSILSGSLKPGTRLVEAHLAAQLGVSRAPVREAFRILEPEGLVVLEPTEGTFVAKVSEDDLREIYTVRSVLEGLAMRLVAERITKDDLPKLSHIVERMEEAARRRDAERVLELDLEFHELIWSLSGHRRLQEILSNMIGPIRMFLALNTQVYEDLVDNAMEHVELLEALSSGEVRKAEKMMVEHIEEAGRRNINYLKTITSLNK